MSDLERVLPETHENHSRLFYDAKAGQYYDRATDLYISLEDAYSLGLAH